MTIGGLAPSLLIFRFTHQENRFFFFFTQSLESWARGHMINIGAWIMQWIGWGGGGGKEERERLACSSHFLLVAAQEQNFGDQFLHVYLQDGNPVAKLGCDGSRALSAALEQNVNNDRWITIAIRYDRYHPLEKKKKTLSLFSEIHSWWGWRSRKNVRHFLFGNPLSAAQINNKSPFNVKGYAGERLGERKPSFLTLNCGETLAYVFHKDRQLELWVGCYGD